MVDPVTGDSVRPMMLVMSGPKVVSMNHTPNPISADVAARRNSTDSSSPNDSHTPTYTNVTSSHASSRTISSDAGVIPSRTMPYPAMIPTTATSTTAMTASPATNLPLMTSSR